jgi:hypothetical protein
LVFGLKPKVVDVLQFFSVKLIEGFAGIWSETPAFFPQYFTSAILLGADTLMLPAFISTIFPEHKKSISVISKFFAKIQISKIKFILVVDLS